MKIGVISDTHDNILMIKAAVELFKKEYVNLVLHAGDHVAPFTAMVWKELDCEFIGVYGNNDGDQELLKKQFRKIGRIYQRPREIILRGKKILLMHEPDNIKELALSEKYDLIIYGHTHRQKIYREGKTLVVNPGEACGWITGKATAITLDLDSMNVVEHVLGESPLPALAP